MNHVEIVDFEPSLQPHFERLNREWLERHFAVEEIDRRVLGFPQRELIEPGGAVIFARIGADVIGTCALKHHGAGVYELTKMAVTAAARGRGVGRQLIDAAIARFHRLGGRRLFLESHRSLAAALRLYEKVGFRDVPRPPGPSPYTRCNVYMVYADPGESRAPPRAGGGPALPGRD